VSEDRIKELLGTFGQIKFFALQKDEDGKSTGVAFFEYNDMMTQQQARTALEGLELGAKKLSVKRPEEVIKMGLVAREQKLGARVVPSKVIYLKNIVTVADLQEDTMYTEICADIRLEAEKFGPVTSMEIPRPGAGSDGLGGGAPQNALTMGANAAPLALEDTRPDAVVPKAKAAAPAPVVPDLSMAIVVAGSTSKAPVIPKPQSIGGVNADGEVAGQGFAFVEFATIEGSSKAKKGLNGRRFGAQLVEAEYFSEQKYRSKDLAKPLPNTDEPLGAEPGMQLAIFGAGPSDSLEEAPVMAD
jgi:RNA recognition motif-containing protein